MEQIIKSIDALTDEERENLLRQLLEKKTGHYNYNGRQVGGQSIYKVPKPSAGADITLISKYIDTSGSLNFALVASQHNARDERKFLGATAGGNSDAHTPDMSDEERSKTDVSTGLNNPSALNTAVREFVEELGINSFINTNINKIEGLKELFQVFELNFKLSGNLLKSLDGKEVCKIFQEQLATQCINSVNRSSEGVAGRNRIMYGVGYTLPVKPECLDFIMTQLRPSDDIGRLFIFDAKNICNEDGVYYIEDAKTKKIDGASHHDDEDRYKIELDKIYTYNEAVELVMAQHLMGILDKKLQIPEVEGVGQIAGAMSGILPVLETHQNMMIREEHIKEGEEIIFSKVFCNGNFLGEPASKDFGKLITLCDKVKKREKRQYCTKGTQTDELPAPMTTQEMTI